MVTHDELSPGYQVAQTAHAIADFLITQPTLAQTWHFTSNSLIVLSTPTASELYHLYCEALSSGLNVIPFREPDILDEITGLAFAPSSINRQFLSTLPLVGKQHSSVKSRENKLKSIAFKMMDEQGFVAGEHALQTGRSLRELFNHQYYAESCLPTAIEAAEQFLTLLYYGVTKNNGVFNKVASIHNNDMLASIWASEKTDTWAGLLYEALDEIERIKQAQIDSNTEIKLFTIIYKRTLELL